MRAWRQSSADPIGTWVLVLSLLLGVNVTLADDRPATAAPSAGPQAADFDELLLQLDINKEGLDETVLLLKSGRGELYADGEDLKRWRLRLPQELPLKHKDGLFYRLKAIAGLAYVLDEGHATVSVTAPAEDFMATSVDDSKKQRPRATRPPLGGFLNYDLLAERAAGQSHNSGLFELGAFNGFGVGVGSFVLNEGEATRLTRLETTWTTDLPDRLTSVRFGDSISQAGMWGRSVRFGGIQYGTNFAVQPGLVTLPLQSVGGLAALPSTVDVYVNNNLASRTEVAPGPFSIANVPVVTGQGDVRVVVRDLLGREQVITQPFYASASLLSAGLHDFSYELGFLREDFGVTSGDYGSGFLATTHRLGITERFTGEMHAELQADRQTAGMGSALLLQSFGILSDSIAFSHGPSGAGGLLSAGLERQAGALSFGIHTQMASEHFTQLGLDPRKPAPRRLTSVNIGLAVPGLGSMGLAYVFLDNRDGQPNELASATYNIQLSEFGFLSVDVSRSLHQAGGTTIGANWTLPLGQRTASSVEATRQRGTSEVFAEVQQGLPSGPGFGYLVQQGNQGTRNITLSAQTASGTYSVTEAASHGENGIRAGASGGVALLDGVHLSRRITDSFGVVEIPDFPNVRIYADNQLMGRTDDNGEVLLPRLRAYEKNEISMEQADLPLDAKVGSLSMDAVPYFRSGTVVRFPITRAHDALLSITLDDGTPLPAGALVRIAGQDEDFPVGHDGVVYLTGLAANNRLRATWREQSCELTVPFPAKSEPLPDLGTYVCTGVRP
jgi:outer membrane usher protein